MARALRIEFAGATYHVTSRGDRREPIFVDDHDRVGLLSVLQNGAARFDAAVLAYCLMGNHYHLVVQTRDANLSRLMRHVNGVYTQRFNRRHAQVGHLFQGRFKAILVDRESYLLEVCRYVELNPVRAGLVKNPRDWAWSSYRAHAGFAPAPDWLDSAGLWSALLGRPVQSDAQLAAEGVERYRELVRTAPRLRLWDEALREQVFLGSEAFVAQVRSRQAAGADVESGESGTIPKPAPAGSHGRPDARSVDDWLATSTTREQAFHQAHSRGRLTMTEIALQAGLSVQHVSRLIRRWETAQQQEGDAGRAGR